MPVRWNFWTGHVPEIIPTLRRALGAYARNAGKFKVGLAKDPEHRWHHYRNEKHRWREMVVIYRTTSPDKAREAESLLIEHGRTRYRKKSRNEGTVAVVDRGSPMAMTTTSMSFWPESSTMSADYTGQLCGEIREPP